MYAVYAVYKYVAARQDNAAVRGRVQSYMAAHVRLRLTEIHALCFRALSARGLNERAARLVSDSMTTCEASGSHSHGLFRLQSYCEALSTSRVDGGAEPVLESPAGAAAVRVDARGAF